MNDTDDTSPIQQAWQDSHDLDGIPVFEAVLRVGEQLSDALHRIATALEAPESRNRALNHEHRKEESDDGME